MQAWNVVYLVGLIVYIGIRGIFGGRTKRNEKVVEPGRQDRSSAGGVSLCGKHYSAGALSLHTPAWVR